MNSLKCIFAGHVVFVVLLVSSIIISSPLFVSAQDKQAMEEIIVTASKIEEMLDESPSSVRVIHRDEIDSMKAQFIVDVLRSIPELTVTQAGGVGKQTSVMIRGGNSAHTLVLIDGVRVNSPTTGDFDFAHINTTDIERIEIVKGPQSSVFGSDAMGGVINIITKKGEGKVSLNGGFEVGSFNTYNPYLTIKGGDKTYDFRLTGYLFKTSGVSIAKDNPEKDGYKSASLFARFGVKPIDNLNIELILKHAYTKTDLDIFGLDDTNYYQFGHNTLVSVKGSLDLFKLWRQSLQFATVRDIFKYTDVDTPFNRAEIKTTMNTIDWQHNLYLSDLYTLSGGFEFRKEIGENTDAYDDSVNNKAFYMNNKVSLLKGDVVLNLGLRHDSHSVFGGKTTFKIGGLYNIKNMDSIIRMSYGTSFKAPTLNELFYNDPWGSRGNLNLKPERSKGWDVGIQKDFMDKRFNISLTYFNQRYTDLIEWVETPPSSWTYTPQNVSEATIKGVESIVKLLLNKNITIYGGYTYLSAKDNDGNRLSRRPEHKMVVSLDYKTKDLNINSQYIYTGKRYDRLIAGYLDTYNIVNLAVTYKISKIFDVYLKIHNLFNEKYEEIRGFGVHGISSYAGMRFIL